MGRRGRKKQRENCDVSSGSVFAVCKFQSTGLPRCLAGASRFMSTVALSFSGIERPKSRWIISPANDLSWFILSALGGYAAIVLFALGAPLAPIFLTFIFIIDGPHVWSTMTRTYFDKSERRKRKRQLLAIVPLLLIGPTMWFLGYA